MAFDLSLTLNRTIILTSVIAISAIALAYWGAHTEHYYVMAGAMGVFALAILVWGFANCYVLYKVVVGSVKWWTGRLDGTGHKDKA